MVLYALSLQDQVEKYGAYVGIAAFFGLAVLSLLYFAQARELKRLREWAGRAPERAQELEERVVAQATATAGLARKPTGVTLPQRPAPPRKPDELLPGPEGQGQATELAEPVEADPATNGTVPPAVAAGAVNGAAAPADGEDATADGEDAPADGEAPPENGVAPPAEGEEAPPPTEDEPEPVEPATGGDEPGQETEDEAGGEAEPDAADEPEAAPAPSPAAAGAAAAGAAAAAAAAAQDATAGPPAEPEPEAQSEPGAKPEPVAQPEPAAEPEPVAQPEPAAEPEPVAQPEPAAEPEPAAPPAGALAAAAEAHPPSAKPPTSPIPRATPVQRAGATPAPAAAPLRASRPSASPRRPAPPARRPATASTGGGHSAGTYALLVGLAVLILGGGAFFFSQLGGDEEPTQPNQAAAPAAETPVAERGDEGQPAIAPAETDVLVLNGTTTPGLANKLAGSLQQAGYPNPGSETNTRDQTLERSTVYYGDGYRAQARRVAERLGIGNVAALDEETRAVAPNADVVVLAGADQAA